MKCLSLFSGRNEKNVTNLLQAELAQRMVKVHKHSLLLVSESDQSVKCVLD